MRLAECAHCGHAFADLLRFGTSTSGRVAHLVCRECFSQWIEPEPLETHLLYPPDSAALPAPEKRDSQSVASLVFRSSS